MNKKVIIFDLDDTLLDTSKLRSDIVKLAQSLGVTKKKALEARLNVRSSSKPFTIENYASFLFPADVGKRQALKIAFEKMFAKKGSFNYPGVEALLKKLSKKYHLVLLTYGNDVLQKKKISKSGLASYFSQVIITPDNTKMQAIKALMKTYSANMLFIDNAKSICDAACLLGLPMIWVTSKNKDAKYYTQLVKRIEKKFNH